MSPLDLERHEFALVLLPAAVLVPVIRGCAWRTVASLALLLAAASSLAVVLPWHFVTWTVRTPSPRGWRFERAVETCSGVSGSWIGAVVAGLGVASIASVWRLSALKDLRPFRRSQRLSLWGGLAGTAMVGCTALGALWHDKVADAGRWPMWVESRPVYGVWIAVALALATACCAWGLHLKLRSMARRSRGTSGGIDPGELRKVFR